MATFTMISNTPGAISPNLPTFVSVQIPTLPSPTGIYIPIHPLPGMLGVGSYAINWLLAIPFLALFLCCGS